MKNNLIELTNVPEKTMKTAQEPAPRLSDDAFYLIALASLLKKMIRPASVQQFLIPGKFITFNYEAGD